MSTPEQNVRNNLLQGNFGMFAMTAKKNHIEQNVLKLSNMLQSTLEIEGLFEILDTELAGHIPHMSLSYENPAEQINYISGELSTHACHYNVILLDEPLGVVTLTRATPFSETEMEYLETILSALIYPLRNTLLYHRALHAAFSDPVTGVGNRASMDACLDREIDLCKRHDTAMTLLMMDLDFFKKTNDTYGHIAGDAVLREVVRCTEKCVRKSDMIFRYGGEEFVVMLHNAERVGAYALAERIRQSIETSEFNFNGMTISTSTSIGLAELGKHDNAHSLLDRADKALYRAKETGRNRVVTDLELATTPELSQPIEPVAPVR